MKKYIIAERVGTDTVLYGPEPGGWDKYSDQDHSQRNVPCSLFFFLSSDTILPLLFQGDEPIFIVDDRSTAYSNPSQYLFCVRYPELSNAHIFHRLRLWFRRTVGGIQIGIQICKISAMKYRI